MTNAIGFQEGDMRRLSRALRRLLLAGLAACLACCGSDKLTVPRDVPAPAPQEFTLAPGQSALLSSIGLNVVFVEVASDGRCPTDVLCVWQGDAQVVATLSMPGHEPLTGTVHSAHAGRSGYCDRYPDDPTCVRYPPVISYAGFRVALLELLPERKGDGRIDPGAYRATFQVTR
jgi:hypothetical protein